MKCAFGKRACRAGELGAVADHDGGQLVDEREGLQRERDALFGHEARHDQR